MAGAFDTTSWSMVLSAKGGGSGTSREALDALCRVYWPPLYAHMRRKGHSEEDARDLTQEFFSRLLEHDFLGHVDRDRGRFRTFLLASLDHFLVNEWKREHTQRRGGGTVTLSMDFEAAEERLDLQAGRSLDPRLQFDRQWARTLLDRVMARLGGEFAAAGKSALFEQLESCLTAQREAIPYRILSERVSMSEGALKVAVHRLRRRYAMLLREEIARTVEREADVDEELRYLIKVMGTPAESGL